MDSYVNKIINTSNPYSPVTSYVSIQRTIYYGTVVSIDDETDGGRIKVRIPDLDNKISDNELPWSYPLLPKFFHIYPQKGEIVRIFLEDIQFPMRSRFWLGSVISQLHKIEYDDNLTALSTTNYGIVAPDVAPSKIPESEGVFTRKTDIAIIGRVNTDIILRNNEVHIRAGKHENNNILKLNTKNPAEINLNFEPNQTGNNDYYSNTVITSDKIAIISHNGIPQFKASNVTQEDRVRIFNEGHPMVRGDVLVEALRVIRDALVNHIHGYSALPAEKTEIINKLEKLEFELMLQKNIVIN